MASLDDIIRDQIAELDTLDRTELVDKWIKAYGEPPLKGARREAEVAVLVRGISDGQLELAIAQLKAIEELS